MSGFCETCGAGVQITFIVCAAIVIISILTLGCFSFFRYLAFKYKKDLLEIESKKEEGLNSNKPTPGEEEKMRDLRQKEEDRAKAIVKDFFEATRVKSTDNNNQKEEKCDIAVTESLVTLYGEVLSKMRSYQTSQMEETSNLSETISNKNENNLS